MDASQPHLPQLPSLSELESRMQVMRVSALNDNQTNQTISQRAELFYQKRSLLLSLCQDLYDGYTTLLDRLNNSKSVSHHDVGSDTDISSEADSILSFQHLQTTAFDKHNIDKLVSQLVTATLDKDDAQHELQRKEKMLQEASKTIELLKKLVMLLDMEKEVAVDETANLGYKLATLLEENRELATEALFMRKEAVRLARCVLKMRDEHLHETCLLQNQIYDMKSSRESVYENVSCFGFDSSSSSSKSKSKKRKTSETRSEHEEKRRRPKWLKRLNPFTKCNITPSSSPPPSS